MQPDLKLENLVLRKTNLELQARLIQLEHADLTKQIKELQDARPIPDNTVLPTQ